MSAMVRCLFGGGSYECCWYCYLVTVILVVWFVYLKNYEKG